MQENNWYPGASHVLDVQSWGGEARALQLGRRPFSPKDLAPTLSIVWRGRSVLHQLPHSTNPRLQLVTYLGEMLHCYQCLPVSIHRPIAAFLRSICPLTSAATSNFFIKAGGYVCGECAGSVSEFQLGDGIPDVLGKFKSRVAVGKKTVNAMWGSARDSSVMPVTAFKMSPTSVVSSANSQILMNLSAEAQSFM